MRIVDLLRFADGTIQATARAANPMTTAGDMIRGGTGGAEVRVAVGTDNYVWSVSPTTHLPVWRNVFGPSPAPTDISGIFQMAEDGEITVGGIILRPSGLAIVGSGDGSPQNITFYGPDGEAEVGLLGVFTVGPNTFLGISSTEFEGEAFDFHIDSAKRLYLSAMLGMQVTVGTGGLLIVGPVDLDEPLMKLIGSATGEDILYVEKSDSSLAFRVAADGGIEAPYFGDVVTYNVGISAGDIPLLDSGGKINASTLPSLAINDVFPVDSQAEMLALTAERGDIAIRNDTGRLYILSTDDPTTLANWKIVPLPTDTVISVAGRTGVVTLANTDISGLGTASTLDVPASGDASSAQVVKGNDGRLSDARTPTAHHGSHAYGGSDAIVPGDMAASGADGKFLSQWGSEFAWLSVPPWIRKGANAKYSAFSDGNPAWLSVIPQATLSSSALSVSTGLCNLFRLPVDLSVTHVWIYGKATQSAAFTLAIYPYGTATSKVWDSGAFDVTINAWTDITANMPFSLSKDTDYWVCITAATAAAGSILRYQRSGIDSGSNAYYGASSGPLSGLSVGIPEVMSMALSSGVFPGTLPTIAVSGSGGPMVLLQGTAS